MGVQRQKETKKEQEAATIEEVEQQQEIHLTEDEMIPVVFDIDNGIEIAFPLPGGLTLSVEMTDVAAQEMVNIIQNKLDGRF